jgi:hypothetical protein
MSQQSVRQAARRSALDAQAVLRKERADRERRLESLAVAVLTALGERDALVRDAERRAGQALRTMTEEGLSLREAVDWCGRGLTMRQITRLLRLDGFHQGGQDASDEQQTGRARLCMTGHGVARSYSTLGEPMIPFYIFLFDVLFPTHGRSNVDEL